MPDYSMRQILTDTAIRNGCVLYSLRDLNTSLLFLLAVYEYNAAPTKTKAITLFGAFLGDHRLFDQYPGDFDLGITGHRKALLYLQGSVEIYDQVRNQARQMNAITRWWTKEGRRIAQRGIFEEVIRLAKLDSPEKHGGALFDVLHQTRQQPASNAWRQGALDAKEYLRNGGFSMYQMGLDAIS